MKIIRTMNEVDFFMMFVDVRGRRERESFFSSVPNIHQSKELLSLNDADEKIFFLSFSSLQIEFSQLKSPY